MDSKRPMLESSMHRVMFAQSRRCGHYVSVRWTDALFDFLSKEPRNALYSIAFYLSYAVPRFGPKEDTDRAEAAYVAASELYDLVDDLVRDTDELTPAELMRSRSFTMNEFRRADETYFAGLNDLAGRYDRYLGSSTDTAEPVVLTNDERRDIRDAFRRIDDQSVLPLLLSMDGSTVCTSLCDEFARQLNDDTNEIIDARISARDSARFNEPFGAFESFMRYATLLLRYESLKELAARVNATRNVCVRPIYLPRGSVWQCGESQVLWLLLHTIAALSVCRGNVYINRLFVILRNVDFFIGCVECAAHWSRDGGREYFDFLQKAIQPIPQARLSLPIDVLLLLVHNRINARNARAKRGLTMWTLGQLTLDYCEFVEVGLLRRRDTLYARSLPEPSAPKPG